MENLNIGKILGEGHARDAVHMAIAPVIAGETLAAGQHVAIEGGRAFYPSERNTFYREDTVGIVDPFLCEPVKKGQRFWLFLYPNTITSLRHMWTHPSLPEEDPVMQASEHEAWLRSYAEQIKCTYAELMAGARAWVEDGDWFCQDGKFEDVRLPEEFWTHYQRVIGRFVDEDKKRSFFSCSC